MEAALLSDGGTDFVSTTWLGIPETGQSERDSARRDSASQPDGWDTIAILWYDCY